MQHGYIALNTCENKKTKKHCRRERTSEKPFVVCVVSRGLLAIAAQPSREHSPRFIVYVTPCLTIRCNHLCDHKRRTCVVKCPRMLRPSLTLFYWALARRARSSAKVRRPCFCKNNDSARHLLAGRGQALLTLPGGTSQFDEERGRQTCSHRPQQIAPSETSHRWEWDGMTCDRTCGRKPNAKSLSRKRPLASRYIPYKREAAMRGPRGSVPQPRNTSESHRARSPRPPLSPHAGRNLGHCCGGVGSQEVHVCVYVIARMRQTPRCVPLAGCHSQESHADANRDDPHVLAVAVRAQGGAELLRLWPSPPGSCRQRIPNGSEAPHISALVAFLRRSACEGSRPRDGSSRARVHNQRRPHWVAHHRVEGRFAPQSDPSPCGRRCEITRPRCVAMRRDAILHDAPDMWGMAPVCTTSGETSYLYLACAFIDTVSR